MKPRIVRAILLFLIGLTLFLSGAGVMVALYAVPAPPLVVASMPDDLRVNVRIRTAEDVARVRGALNTYLFGDVPPTTAECDGNACAVTMQHGVTSMIDIRRPETPNGDLFIYHAGHLGETPDITETVNALLQAGYTVAVFDMPLIGVNPPITLELPAWGTVTLRQHDHLQFLEGMVAGSPVRYFLEPVIAFLNAVEGQYGSIYMTGISGGGWTTTLSAALDTRIDASYPIAGSLPISVHFAVNNLFDDYEQFVPSLYAIAGYADLYVMGSAGRRQIQLLNYYDPCCFSGDYRAAYAPQVNALAEAMGGSFTAYVDDQNRTHTLSLSALALILTDASR